MPLWHLLRGRFMLVALTACKWDMRGLLPVRGSAFLQFQPIPASSCRLHSIRPFFLSRTPYESSSNGHHAPPAPSYTPRTPTSSPPYTSPPFPVSTPQLAHLTSPPETAGIPLVGRQQGGRRGIDTPPHRPDREGRSRRRIEAVHRSRRDHTAGMRMRMGRQGVVGVWWGLGRDSGRG